MPRKVIRPLIGLIALSACIFSATGACAAAPSRPNVVLILADDQGWGDLGVNGNTAIATPHIDSLARDGVMLDRFFVCPVCSPTRGEMLTGRYHPRLGIHNVTTGGERMNLGERTIAEAFKSAGYATGAFGKWHNGIQYPYHPNARGFEEYYGFCSGHWGDYFDPPLEHNGQQVRGKGFMADDLADHAMAFIEQNKDRAFFCYVPFNLPHSPMQVPDRFWQKFANAEIPLRGREPKREDLGFTRAALAMCENIDFNVGRILHRLDELKLSENTIVVYFSDNGPNSVRWNGGMRGIKGSVDEGGVRSPFMIRWPAGHLVAGTKVPQITAVIDLLPTLTDLAGIPTGSTKPLDGVSLKPLLLGNAANWPDRLLFSHWNGKCSVRAQGYRLDDAGHLFDMRADPGQDRDVAKEQPEAAAKLANALADWRQEMRIATLNQDDRPFTVGYREFPITQLPARDGVAHGGIKRSSVAPNCSYFTNWRSPDDSITWDVEVHTPGKYELTVYYTCPADDIGSTVELSFSSNRASGTVSQPNDPPLVGAEHDRVVRKGESYVKDFKPMSLGTIDLPAARGELKLRATNVPGKQVMDMRMIVLTLQP